MTMPAPPGTTQAIYRAMDRATAHERKRIIDEIQRRYHQINPEDQPFLKGFLAILIADLEKDE